MSDDLISRQAATQAINLLKDLEQRLDDYCGLNDKGKSAFRMAITALELFGNAEQLPSAHPQWIPVSEKLPEDIRPVLVTWCNTDPASYYQHIVGKRFTGVAHYKSGKWYWYSSTTEDFLAEYGRYDGEEFDEAIEVLAWCEMPEPYKGEQE